MTRIYKYQLSRNQIQYTFKSCYKKTFLIGFTKQIIYFCKHIPKGTAGSSMIFNQCFSNHHKQCRRHTLTGNIRHYHGKMSVIHHKEIIEVSSHLFCRGHGCINIKFFPIRECRKNTWQHIRLNLRGNIQFCTDTLSFCRHFRKIINVFIDILFHFQNTVRKHLNFIIGSNLTQNV